jgi:hypothetical protein
VRAISLPWPASAPLPANGSTDDAHSRDHRFVITADSQKIFCVSRAVMTGTEANVWRPGSADDDDDDAAPAEQEPEPEPEPQRSYREGVHGSVGSGIGMSEDLANRLESLDAVLAAREWEVYDRDEDFQPQQQQEDAEAAEVAGSARETRRDKLLGGRGVGGGGGGGGRGGGGGGSIEMDGSFTAADLMMDTSPVSSPSSIPSPPGASGSGSSAGGGASSSVAGLGGPPGAFGMGGGSTPRKGSSSSNSSHFVDPSLIPAAAGVGMDASAGGGGPSTPPHVAVGRLRPKHVQHLAASSPLAAE